ncbi:MAG: Binding-protein-dependent transport system inner rane component [Rhodocyclaceae bacterium]|nr:Binding-protein-dependent transport system inner rane component [Rhodocyclaceae bacterium]
MPFQIVILWSDVLVWLLVAACLGFGFVITRTEHLLAAWRRVGKSRIGMAAATVLMVFGVIGLLDSLHYRLRLEGEADKPTVYSIEVLSVLDTVASPVRTRNEKTYSAPFATRLYAKETIDLPGGGQTRGYPRLKYGGAHLGGDEARLPADVARKAAMGFVLAVLTWCGMAALVTMGVGKREGVGRSEAWRRIWQGETHFSWNALLMTAGGLMALILPLLSLAGYYHVFGTDKVGQDVLYQVLKSVRTGLIIGLVTTLVMLPVAVLMGIVAGYFRGWVDDLIQYIYTVLSSIPGVLLIAAAVLMMQVVIDTHPEWFATAAERADLRLLALCFILGITSWTSLCRLLRGETLKLRELEYIQAAQAFGVSSWRIILRHILPNLMHIVVITLVMDFSGLVLAEAVLSYIDIGVDPNTISFGTMINNARLELGREPVVWWSLAAAFAAMLMLVLAANLFADVVRDAFDPRAV